MPRFRIEQRAPGDPVHDLVPWEPLGALDAESADAALHAFFRSNGWHTSVPHHGRGVVHGVGHFRAVPEELDEQHRFVIQRQDAPAGDERHRTWTDVAVVEASNQSAALQEFVEHMQWTVLAAHEHAVVIAGIGPVRSVPAAEADDYRVTPAPPRDDDAW
jgi:hypothetical protein